MYLKPNIRNKRMDAHFTQTELASLINIHKSHLSEIEKGKHFPSPLLIWQIAKVCNCKVDDLYSLID